MSELRERELFQDKCEELSKKHKHLLIEAPTGVGKGKAVMRGILASRSSKKWLVVVPEVVHIDNFWEDAIKHRLEHLLAPKIEGVVCYASLETWGGKGFNLALNECHKISPLRAEYLKTMKFEQIISDSATVSEEIKKRLKEICPFYEYNISVEEAIERELIPTPKIHIEYVELNNTDKLYKRTLKSGAIIKTTAFEQYSYLDSQVSYWKKKYEEEEKSWQKDKWFLSAITRKRFISELKTEKTKELLSTFNKDERVLCFTGTVKQAKELGGGSAIHSKNGKTKNKEVIDAFNNLSSNRLFACAMGKEGLNLSMVDKGIILQLDNNDLGNIQRLGRILRGKFPELYLIVVEQTKDEDYLRKFLKNIKYEH